MLASGGTVVGGQGSEHWFHAVNQLARHTTWAHEPARIYATYGVALFAGLLLLSWWLARRNGDLRPVAAALWAPFGALLALWVNQFLVAAFAEPRPYAVMPQALVLVHRSTDGSFPSDHAVMAGAVAAGIALAHRTRAHRTLALAAAALAVLMAFHAGLRRGTLPPRRGGRPARRRGGRRSVPSSVFGPCCAASSSS